MTLIAGIYQYSGTPNLPEEAVQGLKQSLSRNTSDSPIEYRHDRCYIAKIDIDAFQEPGLFTNKHTISFLTGEPLITPQASTGDQTRTNDLAELNKDWAAGQNIALKRAQGCFSVAHYNPQDHSLCLASDKLGLRPLYYWKGDGYVIFASALRILEAIELVPKRMDLEAVSELAAFGCCLADRTPYSGIRCLEAGQIISFQAANVSREYYWEWQNLPNTTQEIDPEDIPGAIYEKFVMAIRRRLKSREDSVACFLSGGMDSRAIATVLSDNCKTLNTFNFSIRGCLDEVIGRKYAEAISAKHHQGYNVTDHPSKLFTNFLKNNVEIHEELTRPKIVWSGDGGSVCAGWVYLNSEMINKSRKGDVIGAIQVFVSKNKYSVPLRFFRKSVKKRLADFPNSRVLDEINRIQGSSIDRALFFFLLLNDQRRHLYRHFEDIDLRRIELQLPFFDSEFLEALLAVPPEEGLYHKFYHRWFEEFPAVVKSVAWQTYPGHLECPLPVPQGLIYQWSKEFSQGVDAQDPNFTKSQQVNKQRFVHKIFNRSAVLSALFLHKLGIRDYEYLINNLKIYSKYWHLCQGKIDQRDVP